MPTIRMYDATLENTIGNVWWTYQGSGLFRLESDGLLITNKLFIESSVDASLIAGSEVGLQHGSNNDDKIINFVNADSTYTPVDDLGRGYIEVRVYN